MVLFVSRLLTSRLGVRVEVPLTLRARVAPTPGSMVAPAMPTHVLVSSRYLMFTVAVFTSPDLSSEILERFGFGGDVGELDADRPPSV